MLSSPIVIHVQRPYMSEDEYLAHERSSIDAKSMLLIGQAELPPDTSIVFDVQLANGQKPIRAEAKVIAYVAANGSEPGGLRVRFKRFGAATKAFIDRALRAPAPPSLVPAAPASAPTPAAAAPEMPEPMPVDAFVGPGDASGVHRKVAAPVAAPANREALLARLRGRRAS
ncbi:MAG TPA: hypothetical protein VGL19_00885 [Polyangiaceae bacterium]